MGNKAQLIVIPEFFVCPLNKEFYIPAAENIEWSEAKTPALTMLKTMAAKHKVYIVGGSMPEIDKDEKLYNASFVFDREGKLIAKHRKVHLFDIDIPGKMTFMESEVFSPGDQITVFDTEYCKVGLAICYDIRFPELAQLMVKKGAKVIVLPGAFSLVTGENHWELLLRGRALDTQTYVIGCGQARYTEEPKYYQSWGHSTVVDPFGKVLATTDHMPSILYVTVNTEYVEQIRNQLPYGKQRRDNVYELNELAQKKA